jgi:predicted cobalt transporter CbtA
MSGQAAIVLLVAAMVAVVVGLDVLLFRHHVWARLLANLGIVLLFAAFYLRFLKHS